MDEKQRLVRVDEYIPDIYVHLPYATENNFTAQRLYTFTRAYLRYGTVQKLSAAQRIVRAKGFSLLVWDAYRPAAAQHTMWRVLPDSDYVANPLHGFSRHTRGSTVDVSLVAASGAAVPMPSDFDDFAHAKRDYSALTVAALENITLLEAAMSAAGFVGYENEWWHFNDSDVYPVLETPPFELE